MNPNTKRYIPFAALAVALVFGIGVTTGNQLTGEAEPVGCSGPVDEGVSHGTTAKAIGASDSTVALGNVRHVSHAVATPVSFGRLVVELGDKSGRTTRLNLPPTAEAPTYGKRNLCNLSMVYTGCPATGTHDQTKCDKVQRKVCRFCSTDDYDQAKCETWLQHRQTCQNQCATFKQQPITQLTNARTQVIVVSTNRTEITLADGSINYTVNENNNLRERWNVPADSTVPFSGPDWCSQDLQYINCSDPVYDQTKCDKVQSKLCKFCNTSADYDQSKCVTWLNNRSSCIKACDDMLVDVTLDDPYTARE